MALLRAFEALTDGRHVGNHIFILTEQDEDILTIEDRVYLSKRLFRNANPRLVRFNGVEGTLQSNLLINSIIRFLTDNGKDGRMVRHILENKFGITDPRNIRSLTGEHRENFQDFNSEEKIDLLIAMGEMPRGFHKIPGLCHLLRRQNGHPHPLYPEAAAVAWPRGQANCSYIEFMEKAFYSARNRVTNFKRDIRGLIIHEKLTFFGTICYPKKCTKSGLM